MRFREIRGGLRIAISNEENELLEHIGKSVSVLRQDLNERQQEVARKLVSRGALDRVRDDQDRVHYIVCDLQDLWRD